MSIYRDNEFKPALARRSLPPGLHVQAIRIAVDFNCYSRFSCRIQDLLNIAFDRVALQY
jgi:hypothetical protein